MAGWLNPEKEKAAAQARISAGLQVMHLATLRSTTRPRLRLCRQVSCLQAALPGVEMTEQQASELFALLRQIASDVTAIKAQGHVIAKSTAALLNLEKTASSFDFPFLVLTSA